MVYMCGVPLWYALMAYLCGIRVRWFAFFAHGVVNIFEVLYRGREGSCFVGRRFVLLISRERDREESRVQPPKDVGGVDTMAPLFCFVFWRGDGGYVTPCRSSSFFVCLVFRGNSV